MTTQKKYPKVLKTTIKLTVELATEFLDRKYELQRRVNKKTLRKYERIVQAGKWRYDGHPIIFDWNGFLLDGQHRCLAVINTGVPIDKVDVTYGIDPDAYKTMDSGIPRGTDAVFRQYGEKNCSALANAVNLCHQYFSGIFNYGGHSLSNEEACEYIELHPKLRDSFDKVKSVKPILSFGIAGALHYIFSQKDSLLADDFFQKLSDGADLRATSPIKVLRDQLIENKGRRHGKMRRPLTINIIIKCWNDCRANNQRIRAYSWRNSKATEKEAYVEAL